MGGSAGAAAAPAVMPGWPVPAPVGQVLPRPAGGVVVVGGTFIGAGPAPAVAAYRTDGRRRWLNSRLPGCGNCDGGQEARLNPDGTHGPIGPTGDDYWNVDSEGRETPGCAGVVVTGGDCIQAGRSLTGPAVSRGGGRTERWRFTDTGGSFAPEFDVWPRVVGDATGTVYVGFGGIVALDAGTGELRWRSGPDAVALAGLRAGVLAQTTEGVVAMDAAGAVRWTLPGVSGVEHVEPDIAGGQVILQAGFSRPRVIAIDIATGGIDWRSDGRFGTRLLGIGRSGRRYLGVDRELRAVTRSGRTVWRLAMAAPPVGAAELPDGTVVVSAGTRFGEDGLLYRVTATAKPPALRRGSVSLRSRILGIPDVDTGYGAQPAAGTVLRVRMPRATTLTLSARTRGSSMDRLAMPARSSAVPAGESYLRLVVWAPRPTSAVLSVRWRERGVARVRRIPIRLIATP